MTITLLLAAVVSMQPGDGKVDVSIDGKPLTTLHYGPKWMKPFMQPVFGPSGVDLTRAYPFEKRGNESVDHTWHRGLWFAHGDINGVDYWREREGTGTIAIKGSPRIEKETLSFDAELIPPGKPAVGTLAERYTFSARDGLRIVDVEITVKADRGIALKLGDTEEGTLGFRFRDEFREDRGATLLNSNKRTGAEAIWGKQAKWVDYSSKVDGATMGVAIFDHPSNPKHPTFWHARGYGLNAANPFGEHDFFNDSKRDGSRTVKAGGTMTFRYRIVLHTGSAAEAKIDDLYRAYK